ncbi:hypothetical protein, conserved [Leishmania tarentolae]|uniref:Rhodanese domain-containing protein n=1 Tax=Leishmania tarentolae TaxID=5689 RepID=A0A640K8H9_LEITA|nr:hypothetical protein, conserved [Leishmania tarentolae]
MRMSCSATSCVFPLFDLPSLLLLFMCSLFRLPVPSVGDASAPSVLLRTSVAGIDPPPPPTLTHTYTHTCARTYALAGMAQWIPKTAWKVSNLNKRYGAPYVAKGFPSLDPKCSLDAYCSLQQTVTSADVKRALFSIGCTSSGALVIDVRSEPERRLRPLLSPAIVALHPHDILSGAACPILPSNKEMAEIFVVASEAQRAVNACTALRRWGFAGVSPVSVEAVSEAIAAVQKPADTTTSNSTGS